MTKTIRLISCVKVVLILSVLTGKSNAQNVQISVDVDKDHKLISPLIYGRNNNLSDDPTNPVTSANWQLFKDAGLKFLRESGGNNSTKYNWRLKLSSHPDWYNNVYAHDWDYSATSLQQNMPEAKGMWALQLLGYAAKTDAFNFDCMSYNQCKGGNTVDSNWCGNGDITKYLEIWTSDSTTGILNQWFNNLNLSKTQFQYWNMDNEPEVWNSTHDDVVKSPMPVGDYISRYIAVAKKARALFPDIKIVGPVFTNEWQWYNWEGNTKVTDSVTQTKMVWVQYFIKRIAEEEAKSGIRLLDVLDFHFYPGSNQATTLQLSRVFYDTTYIYPLANGVKVMSPSGWDNSISKEYIWQRCNNWLTQYMGANNGVNMGLSEFGSIYNSDPNTVAVCYASMLGTFAKNNVELFSPWDWSIGQWEVLHLFTHYAGQISVSSISSLDTVVSAYSSINTGNDTLSVILVNRDMNNSHNTTATLQNFSTNVNNTIYYQLSNLPSTETFISETKNALKSNTVNISGNTFTLSLPKLSITAVQIPIITTKVNEHSLIETDLKVYPNPVSQSAMITYQLPENENVVIKVFDLIGNEVGTLVSQQQKAGSHDLSWNTSSLNNGVYFIQLRTANQTIIKKIVKAD